MRYYFESYGSPLTPALEFKSGTSVLEVIGALGIRLRPPSRWERAMESIVDGTPGRVVSRQLLESRAPIHEPAD